MKRDSDYNVNVSLMNDEVAAKVNIATGEVVVLKKGHKLPEGFELAGMGRFNRQYPETWIYLEKKLSNLEFLVACRLGLWARAYTNSLMPLSDKSTVEELSRVMGIGVNKAKSVSKKLFDMGVFAKFDVREVDMEYKKYWIFNPYLSFNGRVIDTSMKNLFRNTIPAKVYRGEIE
jgi:hypothetical protein